MTTISTPATSTSAARPRRCSILKASLWGRWVCRRSQHPIPGGSHHCVGKMGWMYGRMIEDANFLRHFGHRWVLRLGRAASLVEVNAEALLAFDADGVIVGADSGARRLLQTVDGQSVGALLGQPLSAVFRNPLGDVMRLARAGNG